MNSGNSFTEIVERFKKAMGVKTDTAVADILGMKNSAFHNRKKSGSIPYEQIISVAKREGIVLDYIFIGDTPMKWTDERFDGFQFDQDAPNTIYDPSCGTGKTMAAVQAVEHLLKKFQAEAEFKSLLNSIDHLEDNADVENEGYGDYAVIIHDEYKQALINSVATLLSKAYDQAQGIDMESLDIAIECAELHLKLGNKQLSPYKKARLITLLYEEISQDDEHEVEDNKIIRLIDLATAEDNNNEQKTTVATKSQQIS